MFVCLIYLLFLCCHHVTGLKPATNLPFQSKYFKSLGFSQQSSTPLRWIDCGDSRTDLFHLKSLEITPDPPQRSAPLTVHVTGYLKEPIESGEMLYSVKFAGFRLATGSLDGCSTLQPEPQLPHCPILAGDYDIYHSVQIPWHVPPGTYQVDVEGRRASDDGRIFCLKLNVSIDLISSSSDGLFV